MLNFLEARNDEGEVSWIAAHDPDTTRIFVWLSNTQRWHRNTALEEEFYRLRPEMSFVPISLDQAAAEMTTWPPIDQADRAWLVDRFTALPTEEILTWSTLMSTYPTPPSADDGL